MSEHSDRMARIHTPLHTRGKLRALVLGLALVLLPAAGTKAATGAPAHLDQAQTTIQGGLSVRVSAWQRVRISRTGLVMRVDVPLCAARRGSAVVLTLNSEAADHGARTSAKLTFGHSLIDCIWYRFTFQQPLYVRRGQMIRLTVARWRGAAPLWGASLHGPNPYRRGSGRWMEHTIDDFAFRIYVHSL